MSNALLMISDELLEANQNLFVHFPEETKFKAIDQDYMDINQKRKRFIVTHPDIPENTELVSPTFGADYDDKGNVTKVYFLGWNPK